MLALILFPPRSGSYSSGVPYETATLSDTLEIYQNNLLVLVECWAGAIGTAVVARGALQAGWLRPAIHIAMTGVAVKFWLSFGNGIHWLADSYHVATTDLLTRVVHGYLEFPALLFPWAYVAETTRGEKELKLRNLLAGLLIAALALFVAAVLESSVSPGRLHDLGPLRPPR
jgi:hypothetical protein